MSAASVGIGIIANDRRACASAHACVVWHVSVHPHLIGEGSLRMKIGDCATKCRQECVQRESIDRVNERNPERNPEVGAGVPRGQKQQRRSGNSSGIEGAAEGGSGGIGKWTGAEERAGGRATAAEKHRTDSSSRRSTLDR